MTEHDKKIVSMFKMNDWFDLPGWKVVTDLGKLMEWMAGCMILYVEPEDLCTDACSGVMMVVKKDDQYLALNFDAWHEFDNPEEWQLTPIAVSYLIPEGSDHDASVDGDQLKGIVQLLDIPRVFCSCSKPSDTESRAINQLLIMEEDRKTNLDFIISTGSRIAAVFPSGNYLEYEIDQRSGELQEVESKDQDLKKMIDVVRNGEDGSGEKND